jgi:uncharacterized protein DUF1552
MTITKMSLPRRTVLRGMGAMLALPLLDSMFPALTAIARAAASPKQRLGFFYVPNGMMLNYFIPKTAGKDFELTPILAPLAEFRDQLTVVSGTANAKADPLDQGSGPHSRAQATWLNGCRPKRTEGADVQAGTTLDQIAAKELGKDTPLESLQLGLDPNYLTGNCEGGFACVYQNTVSWKSPTMPLPPEANPYIVFERLFGDGSSPSARIAQMREGRSILDSVADDMSRLNRRLGGRDRTTVNDYLDAVREVEDRLQKMQHQADATPTSIERPYGIPESFVDHYNLMLDLQRLAFQADITRVFSFQVAREQSSRSYPEAGTELAHHDASHHAYNPEKMEGNARINAYHMTLFAGFLEKMRNTPDGDGSLLDHTIFMYGAGMGDGNEHYPHHLPVVLVGGGGGLLKGGRHIATPDETPLMNVGLSLLDKIGLELPSVGDSTGRITDL